MKIMPTKPIPKAFIGSSTKGIRIAKAIQEELRHDVECTVWNQGIFEPGRTTIEDLAKALNEHEFAIFVFLPEDMITFKGKTVETVRDNVVFELGLFIGKLGRDRNFFVVPKGDEQMHLPSDLAGVTPATYDSNNDNLQAAVGSACYAITRRVEKLGRSQILYNAATKFENYHFKGKEWYNYQDGKKVGSKAQGSLSFEEGGVIRIERTNSDGRFELFLRQNGQKKPSIIRKHDLANRILHVSCDAKVDEGMHMLRFILKDEEADKWVADEQKKVATKEWAKIECYLEIPTTVDVVLRIDDKEVSQVPSNVYIRNLKVVEMN
jgi:hypothetical protein